VTGVRKDESWMKSKCHKYVMHPLLKVPTYAPIFEWNRNTVIKYIKFHNLYENPLYKLYGKAYDCWCSVYKSPADFALLALNNPSFFKKFVNLESKLRSGGSGLYYGRRKIYFWKIMENPHAYLERYKIKGLCPICRLLFRPRI